MKGYVVRKGNQYYAVIYEGRDPVTWREPSALRESSPPAPKGTHEPHTRPTPRGHVTGVAISSTEGRSALRPNRRLACESPEVGCRDDART
jgi:hypothetical protein